MQQVRKIAAINALRGVAILGVMYQHLFWKNTYPGFHHVELSGLHIFPLTFLSNGWAGVNLFFILSGFVLFLPYADGRRRMSSRTDFADFYRRRALRLLPLYYAAVAISFAVWSHFNGSDPDLWKNLSLLLTATFNFTKETWGPKYNVVLWSIGLEIWFSLLFPFLIIAARRVGVKRLFIYAALIAVVVRLLGTGNAYFEVGSPYHNPLKDSLPGRIDDFVLGMLLCEAYVKRFREAPARSPLLWLLAGTAIVWVGCSLWDHTLLGLLGKAYLPFASNVFHAGLALIITGALSLGPGLSRMLLTNRPLQMIGVMSYSIYLWHYIAIRLLLSPGYSYIDLSIYLMAVFSFSALTYTFIEMRSMKRVTPSVAPDPWVR